MAKDARRHGSAPKRRPRGRAGLSRSRLQRFESRRSGT
ncbi:hypothetical protein AZ78_1810 [Lysobacter capsici AZ78]|uniref:Uncharacterized protein n=1 Tax=Lysobacter capsici AZ78 TaxID=1444315 RepID=A0A108U811_9GAMM|nr:hypothetical protein AZ78_1810 [Lysobacter capsici AZ78]